MSESTYDKQAADFLTKYGIRFAAVGRGSGCPPWAGQSDIKGKCPKCGDIHGLRYRVSFIRDADGDRLSFPFWGSLADMKAGKSPTAYDVLSAISGDVQCSDTFEGFCADFGYDTDSRRAYAAWERCAKFAEELREFFTEEEQEALAEIQ